LGEAKEFTDLYADIFTCPVGSLPMKYLGVPIDNKKISKSLWCPMLEKNGQKVGWLEREVLESGRQIDPFEQCSF
jgi:hypothetical protein